jgi:hypothetical protein
MASINTNRQFGVFSTPRRVRIVVASIELNNERAAMKDFSGSIRTSIQRQSGSQVVAA